MDKLKGILTSAILCIVIGSSAQVIVNCPNGIWSAAKDDITRLKGRCNPDAESVFSGYSVSPCDCTDNENLILPNNLCKRTVTLNSNQLITILEDTPHQTDNKPFFTLDDANVTNVFNRQGTPWVASLDPSGSLEIYEAFPNDVDEPSILLFIDETTMNATFDVYVPKGETASFDIFHDFDGNSLTSTIDIPASGTECEFDGVICNVVTQNTDLNLVNYENISSLSFPQTTGYISDVNISLDITYDFPSDLGIYLKSPDGTFVELTQTVNSGELNNFFNTGPNINVTFDDNGIESRNPNSSQAIQTLSFDFLSEFNGANPTGIWELYILEEFEEAGTLNSWSIQICTIDPTELCQFYCVDPSINISSSGTPLHVSGLNITESIPINSDFIFRLFLSISHTRIADLTITLQSPSGTSVIVHDQACAGAQNFFIIYQDDASSGLNCANTAGLAFVQPLNPFSAYQGENLNGIWRLIIRDNVNQNGGVLNSWCIDYCTNICDDPLVLDGQQNSSVLYQSDEYISSRQKINSFGTPKTIEYEATQFIEMEEPFEVNQGSIFHAFIGGCGN